MNIIGLCAQYHDAACALLKDGEIVAAIEEERLNRIKHAGGFPLLAIDFCLKEGKISLNDVERIGYYFNPWKRLLGVICGSILHVKSLRDIRKSIGFIKRNFIQYHNSKDIKKILSNFQGKFHFLNHHLCHASSSFYPSSFDTAAILTVDATGEIESTQLAIGTDNKIKILRSINQPNSLGYLYAAVTQYLGFQRNSDEYKVMGLAPYGKPIYIDKFKEILRLQTDGRFKIDMSYFCPPSPPSEPKKLSKKFFRIFGPPRFKGEVINERHANIAASLQLLLEETLIYLCNHLYSMTKVNNLCMAGGVALNCVANAKILEATKFKNLYIQPAANDPGCAIGAASYIYHGILNKPRKYIQTHSYFGTSYSNEEIKKVLDIQGINYTYLENIEKKAAELLAEGNIIGWFQGKMEWGPRALGNRSILADARRPEMKDVLNKRIKMREPFRPFAPAVLKEDVSDYFNFNGDSPFMLLAVKTKKEKINIIPSVVHVDGTARIQTVEENTNPRFYRLIKYFKKITGISVILNTSFNIAGEPIVSSPEDAIKCFKKADLDYLAIGNFLVKK